MLIKLQVFLILCITTVAFSNNKDLMLQLDPKEIADTFKSVISSRYIREMANQMANKAAHHFINKIKMKEKMKQMGVKDNKRPRFVPPQSNERQSERQGLPPLKGKLPLQVHAGEDKSTSLPPQPEYFPAIHPYREIDNKKGQTVNQQKGAGTKMKQQQMSLHLDEPHMNSKLSSGHDKSVLDENVAFALLKDPSPDGDDWELDSLEISKIRNDIPVVEVKKINGAYFRRLLERLML